MDIDPCKVCGGTELNLVDGYKYCVECGTQNENFKETLIEYQVQEDTVLFKQVKKIVIQPDLNKANVDEEWLKWHTFNFILTGLIDQVILLGARSSVKIKLLWIWKNYVIKYRINKKDIDKEGHDTITQEADDDLEFLDTTRDRSQRSHNGTKKSHYTGCKQEPGVITISVLYTLIYMALNFDRDEIQASDLIRYIREGRLSYKKCIQLIPEGLDYKKIGQWRTFDHSLKNFFTLDHLRRYAFFIIKELDLGAPVTPNLIKLGNRYVKELALPKDLMTFILSLMSILPPVNKDFTNDILRWPRYEERIMSYIIVAMKLLFGLDDIYEYRLDSMSKDINERNNYEKLLNSNMSFQKSQRSFVWVDWTKFITYRKICLSKFYYPIAVQENDQSIDPQLFISHHHKDLEEYKSNIDISSQLTLQVLKKLSNKNEKFEIPKLSFPPSLTPMSTYTDVLINSEWIKELNEEIISEDFCSYSLNHIFRENLSKGRPFENKLIAEKGLIKEHLFRGIKVDKSEKIVNFSKTLNMNETIDQETNGNKQSTTDLLSCDLTQQKTIHDNVSDALQNENDDILSTRSDYSHPNVPTLNSELECDNILNPELERDSILNPELERDSILNPELERDEIVRSILDVYFKKYRLRKPRTRRKTNDDFVINKPNFGKGRKTSLESREKSAATRQSVDNILSKYFARLQNLPNNTHKACEGDDHFRLNDEETNIENEMINEDLNGANNEVADNLMDDETDHLNDETDHLNDETDHLNDETDHLNDETKDEIDEMDLYMDCSHDDIPDIDFSRFNTSKTTLIDRLHSETREELELNETLNVDNLNETLNEDNLNATLNKDYLNENLNEEYSQDKTDSDEESVKQDVDDNSDCSDDMPLNVLFQNMSSHSQASTNIACWKEMLDDKIDGKPSAYWIRHYSSCYESTMKLTTRFTKELDTFFPANFTLFFKLCASIIETANNDLYGEVVKIEDRLSFNLPSFRNA